MKKKHLKISILELRKNKKNPKLHADELIKKSIEELGFVDDIVIDENNIILAGHGRLKALQDLGHKKVEVIQITGWTKKQKDKYLLLSNKSVELGGWDDELLKDFDNDILLDAGFDSLEIDNIFKDETAEDDFDVEEELEKIKKPKTKKGDIYQLGKHRLMCGDSTNEADVEILMSGKKANMVFTDPPYNVDYSGGMGSKKKNTRGKILNDKMSKDNFYQFLEKATDNMLQTCNGAIYICMSSTELDTLKHVFQSNGGHFQSFIIWVKNAFTLSRADWQNQYEPILYGWSKKTKNHYFVGHRDEANVWQNLETLKPEIDDDGKMIIKLGEYHLKLDQKVNGQVCIKKECTDIWREKKPQKSLEHPTMKPIKLIIKAIKANSKRGGIVQDLFGGSGSTLIACEKKHRKCYMMELDPKYCDVIIKRYEKFTEKKAKKI